MGVDTPQVESGTKRIEHSFIYTLKGGGYMADEVNQEPKADMKKAFSTIFKVILGLAFLALGAWFVYKGWVYLWYVIKGTVGLFFILAGVITLAIAKE
jgi:hypothetical protein